MKSGYYYINVTANFTDKAEEVDECPQGEIILYHRDGVSFAKLTPANHINCADCPTKETFEKLVSLPDCNDCGDVRDCTYAPQIGEPVRNNCPLHRPIKQDTEISEYDAKQGLHKKSLQIKTYMNSAIAYYTSIKEITPIQEKVLKRQCAERIAEHLLNDEAFIIKLQTTQELDNTLLSVKCTAELNVVMPERKEANR